MEKHVNNFYKIYSECKDCNSKRGLKRYYENNDKTSNQQKISMKKNRQNFTEKITRLITFKELLRSYGELENG